MDPKYPKPKYKIGDIIIYGLPPIRQGRIMTAEIYNGTAGLTWIYTTNNHDTAMIREESIFAKI